MARNTTLALWLVLLLILGADHFLLRATPHWQVWLFQSLPLLLPLRGLLQRQARSGIWLCFMSLFYFLMYVGFSAGTTHRTLYILFSLLVVLLFSSSMLFARWQIRSDKLVSE